MSAAKRLCRSRLAWLVALLVFVAVVAAPAPAQRTGGVRKQDPAAAAAAVDKKKKAREIDEAYKASLKTIPDKPKPDPWGGIRSK
jgi:hypothetical protein